MRHPVARSHHAWTLAAIAALAGAAVYLNALPNGFVYDDLHTILLNLSIRDLRDLPWIFTASPFRPILNASYALDFSRTELDPFGYHLTNLTLHAVNVLLLFWVVLALVEDASAVRFPADTRARNTGMAPVTIAFASAALFAVHPMMTGAVAYISGRSEVLCATFLLLSVLALRRWLGGGSFRALAAGLTAWALAVGTKETAGMLPFVLLVYDRLFLAGEATARRRRLVQFHLPFLGIVALGGALRMWRFVALEATEIEPPLAYALMQLDVFQRYLHLLVLPIGQSLVHPIADLNGIRDPRALLGAAHVLALAGLAVAARRRAPVVAFGAAWFLLMLVPSTSLVPLQELMAEHRVYVASCGFFVTAAGTVEWLLRGRRVPHMLRMAAAPAFLVLLIGLGSLTVARNRVWLDSITLWQDAARKAPDTWVTHYGLGEALQDQGRCREAVASYRRATELLPGEPRAYLRLGWCLAQIGNPGEAVAAWSAALDRDPANVEAGLLLAGLHESTYRDFAKALEVCRDLEPHATPDHVELVGACMERNQRRIAAEADLAPHRREVFR